MATTQQLKKNIDWKYIDAVGISMHKRGAPGKSYLSNAQRRSLPNYSQTEQEKTAVGHVYLIKDTNPECPNVPSKGAYEVDGVQYGLVVMLGRNKNNGSFEYDGTTASNQYEVADPKSAWVAKVYGNQDAQAEVERFNAPAQQLYCAHMKNGDESKMFSSDHIERSLIKGAIDTLGQRIPGFSNFGANFDPVSTLEE